jgi:hypothetical protein
MGLSRIGCKWEPSPPAPPSGWAESVGCSHARTPTHARLLRVAHTLWLLVPVVGAFVGNATFVGGLAAGLGGALVCLLVVSMVGILRRRRSARATDPASDVRTLLYVD